MKISKEEPSSSATQAIGLITAVKELHVLTTMDLHKLLRDSRNLTIHYPTEKGLLLKVDVEKVAGYLPLHLTAVLMSTDRDEAMFRYLLRGICLLHSLCDLAARNPKLDQNFLGNVRVLEQLVDLVFYLLIVLGGCRQEDHSFSRMHLVHSTLVACTLYLLTGFISTKWQDIVTVLLAHPKIDIFMDAAFGSVRITVRSLEITLLAYYDDQSRELNVTAEQEVYYLSQQCEASLQFLQSLCRQKLFKERLVKNKELCRKGGILFLAQSILKLKIQPSLPNRIKAAVSRLKSKILSILLNLCEVESISYLDEVASSPQSLDLAKSVALEVFDVLTASFGRDSQHLTVDRSHPMGFVHLNAMRLTDILSDDSNFRSYVMLCLTKVLTAIISLPHEVFLSCWCSSNLQETEEDASIEYDIFAAVGSVLDNTSADVRNTTNLEFNRVPNSMPGDSYAHNKTSLLVKLFANLHCFVPNICEEQEKNLFVHKVLECLQMDLSNVLPGFSFASNAPKVANARRNLRSLLCQAESLIPKFLNKEDVQLLRVFVGNLQSLFTSTGSGENRVQDSKFKQSLSWDKFSKLNINEHNQEAQSTGQFPSPLTGKEPVSLKKRGGNLKEGMSENVAFPCIEQHKTRAGDTNQGDDLNRQDQGYKGVSGKTTSGGAIEKDKDAQNIETSGSDTSSAKGKNAIGHMYNGERSKSKEHFRRVAANKNPEDEKVETLQRRKRKRNIMNEEQVTLIERAILDEPDMHRNAASLQSWADKLNFHGSEVTPSQLKNWLNNRKAKLARIRAAEADVGTPVLDKQKGQILGTYDSPDSPGDVSHTKKDRVSLGKVASGDNPEPPLPGPPGFGCNAGQYVVLVDVHGDQVGKGNVFQVHGMWCGKSLEESGTYVVDFTELTADKADKGRQLPYPSEAVGTTFAEAEAKFGVMRVLWDSNRVFGIRTE